MANYNLTDQTISSSFQQLLQKDESTGTLYDGTGSVVSDLDITSSYALTASYAENVDDPTWDEIQNKPSGLVSGAAQIETLLPSGVVSGSSQIDITQTTGNLTSSRIDGIVLSASYAENGGVTSIIAGNNINIDQSTGDVTISSTTTASADWNNLTNKPDGIVSGSSQLTSSYDTRYQLSGSEAGLPSGVVSGSSQIILQDTTGDLSGSRIDGQVTSALSSSYSEFAETSSYALNFNPSATASYALFSEEAVNAEHADAVQFPVIAKETLSKGDPVYVSGYNNGEGKPEVLKADASDSSKMPVVGLAMVDAVNNDQIFISVGGSFPNVDTSTGLTTPQVGQTLYVASGGGYTNVKPTGTNLIQNIGVIGRVQQNTGEILVSAIQRTNDVPNISNGYGWFGNSDGVAIAQSTGSFAKTDLSNTFTQNQTITGSLEVTQAVVSTQVEVSEAVITPAIESQTGKVTIFNNVDISGSINLEANNSIAATQLQADDSLVVPFIESPTGTVTIGSNTIVSGSLILEQGNPIQATQLQADESVVTPSIESTTGTTTIMNTTVISGSLEVQEGNPVSATQFEAFDSLVAPFIESPTGTIELGSYVHFQGGMKTNVGNVNFSSPTVGSVDFDDVTMQVLDLPASGVITLNVANVQDGQVINVLVKQGGTSTITLPSNVKESSGASYQVTQGAGARDILTFATYDYSTTNEIYLINVINLV